ncbi:sigma-70 family RNA polymerase sigma factor [Amnibacterium setariae]|uniref:Sigma-70 family RNA polymerase sigma factor n=1 Tax=Amnibacterium setariae TaxID=2306585 RepID=A0A3A1TW58_9MICO|nr:sigma-70 family RNA polymerase sigma factor [Amnibacterium setariae]
MTVLQSDEVEWSRALVADERAFGELFQRHHRRVFRHALRLVVLPADADEVMASAFFELWRRRADVHLVDGSVLPWLLATATLLSRNRVRGAIRYQRVLAQLPREEAEDAAETATDALERRELRREIGAALRRMSATDAALVTLTVIDGLTTAEAGAAVGLNPGAARMRLVRARTRLRVLLEHDAPVPRASARLVKESAS